MPTAKEMFDHARGWLARRWTQATGRGAVPGGTLTIVLAAVIGLLAGFGAVLFTLIIETVTHATYGLANDRRADPLMLSNPPARVFWSVLLVASPALGMLFVSWLTRRFAPEANGAGVPEVITAVARNDGVIRPQVALVKILASGVTIGAGGSVGREGPIVQIGSALGSGAGQLFKLSARNIKLLVAAGAAAGISATFNAPIAGVIFASEIILGSFAVETLTPIVLASVIADVVQQHVGEHRFEPAFRQLDYEFAGAWVQLPSYVVLGLVAGLASAMFVKALYRIEDLVDAWLPSWWKRALVIGGIVGVGGLLYPATPPNQSQESQQQLAAGHALEPPLMAVGYGVVDHALHLRYEHESEGEDDAPDPITVADLADRGAAGLQSFANRFRDEPLVDKRVVVPRDRLVAELLWLLPLVFLKPLMTSLTLAGGGSGGVFAPSLFLGATLGASFGIVLNLLTPDYSHSPGVYAIVGMAAVVAGTTQGVLSAILIVYEMTGNYQLILPVMAAAGLSSLIARVVDPDSIYYKKLTRRGENISRGHDLHHLDHIMVRDVMIRHYPLLKPEDTALDIVRIARENPEIESLPVMG
ncbi:MAG: chloride channel protein, partial [Planctomycetota bacterium]